MLLSSPTFSVELLPNAIAYRPELFTGLDAILPRLDCLLEDVWSGDKGAATEVLITANLGQAEADARSVFYVGPITDTESLARVIENKPHFRLVPIQYDTAQWQKNFTRFIVEMRIAQRNALDLKVFLSSSDLSSGRRAS
jgi:hypothetical protein